MNKVAQFIVLLSLAMILTGCANSGASVILPNEGSQATDIIITSSVAESTCTTTVETTVATTVETTTATTSAEKNSPNENEIQQKPAEKDALLACYNSLHSGANLISDTNELYIYYWNALDYSFFKRTGGVFDAVLEISLDEYDTDIVGVTEDLCDVFKQARTVLDDCGFSEAAELVGNCSDSYWKLRKTIIEYSGTFKEYLKDYVTAYNNYISDYTAFENYLYKNKYISESELQPLSKIDEYKDASSDNTKSDSSLSLGQKNALKAAESYLKYSSFSYKGLIEQLEYEGYSHDESVYAVDNCGADWQEQALNSAKGYLRFSSFSYVGLINQLEFEQFTHDEAMYGVENCGADWYEQAAISAESYLKYSAFSRSRLIEQLEYEGFTHEQAVYGAEQNGY